MNLIRLLVLQLRETQALACGIPEISNFGDIIIRLNQNWGIYHYATDSRRITCRYNGFDGLSVCTIAYFQAVLSSWEWERISSPLKVRCLSFQYKLVSCSLVYMSCYPDIKLEFTRFISTSMLTFSCTHFYLAPIGGGIPRPHRGRARYCNAHVCLFVTFRNLRFSKSILVTAVCLWVCLFVCPSSKALQAAPLVRSSWFFDRRCLPDTRQCSIFFLKIG